MYYWKEERTIFESGKQEDVEMGKVNVIINYSQIRSK